MTIRQMYFDRKFVASVAVCITLFLIINLLNSPTCSDCFARRGLPFPYYCEGGFAGGAYWIWGGLLGDALAILTSAMFLWMLLWLLPSPEPKDPATALRRSRSWGVIRFGYGTGLALDDIATILRQIHGQTEPRFRPDNDDQLFGMVIAYAAIAAVAWWLIHSGIKRIASRLPDTAASSIPTA